MIEIETNINSVVDVTNYESGYKKYSFDRYQSLNISKDTIESLIENRYEVSEVIQLIDALIDSFSINTEDLDKWEPEPTY